MIEETERERERERDGGRNRERERERQTDRQRQKQRQRGRYRERQRETETDINVCKVDKLSVVLFKMSINRSWSRHGNGKMGCRSLWMGVGQSGPMA